MIVNALRCMKEPPTNCMLNLRAIPGAASWLSPRAQRNGGGYQQLFNRQGSRRLQRNGGRNAMAAAWQRCNGIV